MATNTKNLKIIFRIIATGLLSLPLTLFAQLTADADPDKVHCFGADNNPVLF